MMISKMIKMINKMTDKMTNKMTDRINKIITLAMLLIVFIPPILSGCQLAKEGASDLTSDKLIGVFVTLEYLDLFDHESYLNDNISTIIKGKKGYSPKGHSKYEGRIYAALKDFTCSNMETGSPYDYKQYVFEELEGVPFYMSEEGFSDGNISTGVRSNGMVSEIHMKVGDESSSIEGTIYLSPYIAKPIYLNPVYQSTDGEVYLTSGQGIHFSGSSPEGTAYSQKIEEKYVTTENNKKIEKSFSVAVTVKIKYAADYIKVIQMDAMNKVLSSDEYIPREFPEKINIYNDAEYVIVESSCDSPDDGKISRRELLTGEDEWFNIYTLSDEGIFEAESVNLIWHR